MRILINYKIVFILFLLVFCLSWIPAQNEKKKSDATTMLDYNNIYDPISDQGQYWMPEFSVSPKKFWQIANVANSGTRNSLTQTSTTAGLQYHLLCQSIQGLVMKAIQQGKTDTGIWLTTNSNTESYQKCLAAYAANAVTDLGTKTVAQLLTNVQPNGVKNLIDGYVLTDVVGNPESSIVAAMASSVYNSIIVDIRDSAVYKSYGYSMKYDARRKTTADAWSEFKNNCNNTVLILSRVQIGELHDLAIAGGYFILNINKKYEDTTAGQNISLMNEVMAWMKPNSPMLGWEGGVGEQTFVLPASQFGLYTVASDWTMNTTMTSVAFKSRQGSSLAKVLNPKTIDYSTNKTQKFASFCLTDGDNVAFMVNNFDSQYFSQPKTLSTKMAHGMPIDNLSMMIPDQLTNLLNKQTPVNTVFQALGPGYIHADYFGNSTANRTQVLAQAAKQLASHMRQHRVKILQLMADPNTMAATEAYQAFAQANDQLEGIVVISYGSAYTLGVGAIDWVTNANGIKIPVVYIKYAIWNFGTKNLSTAGSPTFIANKLNAESSLSSPFSAITVHAWSKFTDTGFSNDELAENTGALNVFGAGAAEMCQRRLNTNINIISLQELIWRIRMYYYSDQTNAFLNTLTDPTTVSLINKKEAINVTLNLKEQKLIFSDSINGVLTIYDSKGSIVRQANLKEEQGYSFGQMEAGLYILEIKSHDTISITKKIIIAN